MRRNVIILPGESTVRHWLNSITYSTGCSKEYMEQIKLKFTGMKYTEKNVLFF